MARLSHHRTSSPSGTLVSGYQVDRGSSEISGMTVSTAYRMGLKQRTSPSPHEPACGDPLRLAAHSICKAGGVVGGCDG